MHYWWRFIFWYIYSHQIQNAGIKSFLKYYGLWFDGTSSNLFSLLACMPWRICEGKVQPALVSPHATERLAARTAPSHSRLARLLSLPCVHPSPSSYAAALQTILWGHRGRVKSELVVCFLAEPGHVQLSRLRCTYPCQIFVLVFFPPFWQSDSQLFKLTWSQNIARLAKLTFKDQSASVLQPFLHQQMCYLLLNHPFLCQVFALSKKKIKNRILIDGTLRSSAQLCLKSIRPNESWAQAVRLGYILSGQVSLNQRCQPSALSNINRSLIRARRVEDCTQGTVNREMQGDGRKRNWGGGG